MESITPLEDHLEIVQLSAARARATEEAGAAIARQLNGPLTALLLYMNEIKQHSHQFSQAPGNRALSAAGGGERASANRARLRHGEADVGQSSGAGLRCRVQAGKREPRPAAPADGARRPGLMFAPETGQKPLTKREREVLSLISEGCSNKQGALRMNISPRTFESHRAEAMRKLGARNTADLVRKALLQPA